MPREKDKLLSAFDRRHYWLALRRRQRRMTNHTSAANETMSYDPAWYVSRLVWEVQNRLAGNPEGFIGISGCIRA
jgi:hypothetical protein